MTANNWHSIDMDIPGTEVNEHPLLKTNPDGSIVWGEGTNASGMHYTGTVVDEVRRFNTDEELSDFRETAGCIIAPLIFKTDPEFGQLGTVSGVKYPTQEEFDRIPPGFSYFGREK